MYNLVSPFTASIVPVIARPTGPKPLAKNPSPLSTGPNPFDSPVRLPAFLVKASLNFVDPTLRTPILFFIVSINEFTLGIILSIGINVIAIPALLINCPAPPPTIEPAAIKPIPPNDEAIPPPIDGAASTGRLLPLLKY